MGLFAYIKNGVKYKMNQFPGAYPASRVSYNGSDVESALDELNADLGDKSSASSVTGNDAFAKIATLKSTLTAVDTKFGSGYFYFLRAAQVQFRYDSGHFYVLMQTDTPTFWYMLDFNETNIIFYKSTDNAASWTAIWTK